MKKPQQVIFAFRDLLYTLALAVFGWLLADFPDFVAHPMASTASFFEDRWNLIFVCLLLAAYGLEILVCPGLNHPKDEVPIQWRRWKGMLMEANLVPAIFCARLNVMQMSQGNSIRVVGYVFFTISLVITVFYGTIRARQIKHHGENTFSTTGIFSRLRFPEYLAQLFYSLAVAFIFKSWLALLATLLLFRYQIEFLQKLDRIMAEKYGSAWVKYTLKTKRLIPFVF
jgi:protein-S-isoprenylcysteine O-methyltransferase Ste14